MADERFKLRAGLGKVSVSGSMSRCVKIYFYYRF